MGGKERGSERESGKGGRFERQTSLLHQEQSIIHTHTHTHELASETLADIQVAPVLAGTWFQRRCRKRVVVGWGTDGGGVSKQEVVHLLSQLKP